MKPAWQVAQSAAAMDRALRAGLTRAQLVTLAVARAARRNGVPHGLDHAQLREALRRPGARVFDETMVQRERRGRR